MEQQISDFVAAHPDWKVMGNVLVGEWKLENFTVVRRIVHAICDLADQHNHHPTVTFGYNTIKVETTTHDVGNMITDKDVLLAVEISELIKL